MRRRLSALMLPVILAVLTYGCADTGIAGLGAGFFKKRFKTVAVLPAATGDFIEAQEAADRIAAGALKETRWFKKVVEPSEVKKSMNFSEDLAKDVRGFIDRAASGKKFDIEASERLSKALGADAFFLIRVSSWGYGVAGRQNVARVGVGLTLVDGGSAKALWEDEHEITEEYWASPTPLEDLYERIIKALIEDMPH